jgi:hypothetical protein
MTREGLHGVCGAPENFFMGGRIKIMVRRKSGGGNFCGDLRAWRRQHEFIGAGSGRFQMISE